jgi:hypothetical protein
MAYLIERSAGMLICGRAWTLSPGGGVQCFKVHPRGILPRLPSSGKGGKDKTNWDVVEGFTLPMYQISEKLPGLRCENE